MSKPLKHDNDLLAQVDKHTRSRKRWPHGHSLCNQPPAAPTGLSITWDRVEQQRHGVTRGIVSWDEATVDVDGFDISPKDIAHYDVAFQKSDDGSTPDAHTRRFTVHAKDADADSTAEKIVHNIHKKYYYRAKVRAVAKGPLRGPWSSWTSWQHPNPSNNAAAPSNVQNIETDKRVGITWDPAGDFDATTNLPDLSVSHYQVQVALSIAFTTLKADAKHIVNDHFRYVVPTADLGDAHYLRVRSVSHDGDVSAWQPSDDGIEATDTSGTLGGLPAGSIHHFAMAPSGSPLGWDGGAYLECNGQAVSRSTFSDLFAAIGTTFGNGNGTTTFNVPDMKNRIIINKGNNFALADNDGITETSRTQAHDPHADHADQGSHAHDSHTGHGGHGGHGPHAGESSHTHGLGGGDTGNPTGGSSATVGGGNVAGAGHNHSMVGLTSSSGSSHGPGHDASGAGGDGHPGHSSHSDHGSHAAGGLHGFGHGNHGDHTKHHRIVLHAGIKS